MRCGNRSTGAGCGSVPLSGLVEPSRVPVHAAGVTATRPQRSGGVGLCSSPHIDAGTVGAIDRDHRLELRHATGSGARPNGGRAQTGCGGGTGGYTGHSRIAALIHRAAPVQLSYLGYFAPSYLQAIDGWIGDQALFAGLDSVDREAHQLRMVQGLHGL